MDMAERQAYFQGADLIMFMGQSNMAGRGEAAKAPVCLEEAGAEYRAVTAPDCLCPVREPFGADENRKFKINDELPRTVSVRSGNRSARTKTGGLRSTMKRRKAAAWSLHLFPNTTG